MSVKVFITITIIAIIAIIIGLVVLLQKQPKSTTNKEAEKNGLEIVGAQGSDVPSVGPSTIPSQSNAQMPKELDQPTKKITNLTEPEMNIDTKKEYSAILSTTAGDITIALTAKETPITVNNFVSLARKDFYNDTIFHRVIEGFMIQGGDPKGDGSGGPGYKFDDEEFEGEYARGTVAMANSGPDTNGSQFFIMHKSSTSLPKSYVIFGTVTDGLDVVDTIATAEVTTGMSGELSTPIKPVKITKVKIIEK